VGVVSNTSPLIAFSRIDQLPLLRDCLSHIVIPEAVARELREGARTGEPIIALDEASWIEVVPVEKRSFADSLCGEVDAGEAEAIALADETKATLLIDDRAGRNAAARLGLP
jgi:predicted nucleic acid-binding protein